MSAATMEGRSLAQMIAADNERIAAQHLAVMVGAMSTVELADRLEVLGYDVIDPGMSDEESNDLARFIARQHLDAIEAEVARRDGIARRFSQVASPHNARFAEWVDVAARVREVLSVPNALDRIGWPMKRVGRDGQGREEHAGACVVCGGRDRFRAWSNPGSRYWCRRCEASGDVVTLWRLTYDLGFVDACRALAGEVGLTLPEPSKNDSPRASCLRDESRGESFSEPSIAVIPLRRDNRLRISAIEIRCGQVVAR